MWPDHEFPEEPYPGRVPPGSFAHVAGVTWAITPDPWRIGDRSLDGWLAEHGAAPLADRIPLLAYGSNRCPSKISWLRAELGLGAEPVVVLHAHTTGLAAVWAAGLRRRDGRRPAVLAAAPGVAEEHKLWLATPEQVAALDRCEARGDRHRLVRLRTAERPTADRPTGGPATVRTEDGAVIIDPWCYLGLAAIRRPLLVRGRPVRCTALAELAARGLAGEPAPGDGLEADTVPVPEVPHPDQWPAALFAYGLLQPGQRSWWRVAPHAAGPARPAAVPGAVYDTGRGYPAWLPGHQGRTPGMIVPLRDPRHALPGLDAYEGPEYRRIRVRVPADGTVCWAYAWQAPTAGLRPLPAGWTAR